MNLEVTREFQIAIAAKEIELSEIHFYHWSPVTRRQNEIMNGILMQKYTFVQYFEH